MFNQSLAAKRIFLNACLVIIAGLMVSAQVDAARFRQDPAERQRALDLYESNNFAAALPLLEKLAISNPNDAGILSRLGFALYATSIDEKDASARQKMRDRARSILLKSQSLGDNSNLTRMTLAGLSAGVWHRAQVATAASRSRLLFRAIDVPH